MKLQDNTPYLSKCIICRIHVNFWKDLYLLGSLEYLSFSLAFLFWDIESIQGITERKVTVTCGNPEYLCPIPKHHWLFILIHLSEKQKKPTEKKPKQVSTISIYRIPLLSNTIQLYVKYLWIWHGMHWHLYDSVFREESFYLSCS